MKTRIKIILGIVFAFCLSLTACANQDNISETVIVDEYYSYAGYESYEGAIGSSDVVVYGYIKEIGKTFEYDYGETYTGKPNVEYYTPIVITVKELIKGSSNTKDVTFYALGGVVDDVMYEYRAFDTENFKVGDKILTFLGRTGPGYGAIAPSCVISEDENGKATREALGENKEADTLEKQVELVKNAYSKMLTEGKVTE